MPISTISGLSHLENEQITVLADGDIIENLLVENGTVKLKIPASKIVAGLPYEFEIQTLNLEGDSTLGLSKIVNSINVFVDKSREDFFVVGTNGQMSQNPRSIESINNQNYLYSGNIVCYSFSDYTKQATVHLKQPYPFPLTINAITLDVSLEDTNA